MFLKLYDSVLYLYLYMTVSYILLAVGFRRFLSCLLLPDMISDQMSDFPGLSLCISGSPSPVFQLLTVSPWLSLACLPVLLCQKSIERRSQPVQMENCPSESTRDDLSEDLRCRTPCLRIFPVRSCRRSCL